MWLASEWVPVDLHTVDFALQPMFIVLFEVIAQIYLFAVPSTEAGTIRISIILTTHEESIYVHIQHTIWVELIVNVAHDYLLLLQHCIAHRTRNTPSIHHAYLVCSGQHSCIAQTNRIGHVRCALRENIADWWTIECITLVRNVSTTIESINAGAQCALFCLEVPRSGVQIWKNSCKIHDK